MPNKTDTNYKLLNIEKMWDESARDSSNRMKAVHFVENGRPLAETIYDDIFKQINQFMTFASSDYVLEVGTGAGLLLERIAAKVAMAYGTDISDEMLKLVPHSNNISVSKMESDKLQFADQSFDKVICYSVFQYFPNVEYAHKCFSELVRVCKKGGTIIVGDVFNGYLKEVFLREQKPSLRQRAHESIVQMTRLILNKSHDKFEYLFIEPCELHDWAVSNRCSSFSATLSLSRQKPMLHKMYRYDAVIIR